ncbi:MAG: GntR family transcriptional regulator, partial [Planctomycetes bacterium]|nr:GntR family transcriptional regulator [Planctomycetota bacterium]
MPDIVNRTKSSAAEKLADRLRKHVMALPPGTRLVSEPQLAEQFDVGRSTLRSALAILKREGYVERAPRRGTLVSRPLDSRPVSAAVVTPVGRDGVHGSFNTDVLMGMTSAAGSSLVDITFLLGSLNRDITAKSLRAAPWNRYDGILVFELFDRQCAEFFRQRAKSAVSVDFDATELGITSVCFDNHASAAQLAGRLMDMGHRRFAFMGPVLGGRAWDDPALIDRLRGIMDVVSHRGGLFLAQHVLSV